MRDRPKPVLSPAAAVAPTLPVPARLQVEDGSDGLRIRWRWLDRFFLVTVAFALFWNGLLIAAAVTDVRQGTPTPLLLFLPIACVGIGLLYGCLATVFNSTEVRVERERLSVWHGPLPWPGNLSIPTRDLRQLFVVRSGQGTITYQLCALLPDGRKRVLVSGIGIEDRARFLEYRLEAVLGIADRAVKGEIARP